MTPKQYTVMALSTESKIKRLHIGNNDLLGTLRAAVAMSNVIDQLKKVIFYGREPDFGKLIALSQALRVEAQMLEWLMMNATKRRGFESDTMESKLDVTRVNPRLLHAAFGKFGESGELLEALLKQGMGEELDEVNFVEETGDGQWYDPLIYDELGLPEECFRTANIAKLNLVRYVQGFSQDAAVNRKKELERKAIAFVIEAFRNDPEAKGDDVLAQLRQAIEEHVNATEETPA
jgi:hypothetical protein